MYCYLWVGVKVYSHWEFDTICLETSKGYFYQHKGRMLTKQYYKNFWVISLAFQIKVKLTVVHIFSLRVKERTTEQNSVNK